MIDQTIKSMNHKFEHSTERLTLIKQKICSHRKGKATSYPSLRVLITHNRKVHKNIKD